MSNRLYRKRNGVWEPLEVYTRASGSWRRMEAYTKQNGTWIRMDQISLPTRLSSGEVKGTSNRFGGNADGFRLRIHWQLIATEATRSQVMFRLFWESTSGFSAYGAGGPSTLTTQRNWTMRIPGGNVTVQRHMNIRCNRYGGSRLLHEVPRWIKHASDGSLSITVGAQGTGLTLDLSPGVIHDTITAPNTTFRIR